MRYIDAFSFRLINLALNCLASKRMNCAHRVVSAEQSIEYVKNIINSMGGDMMDFMCGKYDRVSSCNAGHSSMMDQFRGISRRIETGSMRPKSSSPVKPMLQLFINGQDQ